ncbi:hypothetical protein H1X69_15370 [Streptomyces griseoaurantiacus]|uniref:Uncharacterized protein n=1 Tax=Streptomyces griseoaurantiacus TaxID=68213 RepID=A0A7W2HV70_9ACTN|nr:hypothetical protein [Streptomyces griseoaurantiacus]
MTRVRPGTPTSRPEGTAPEPRAAAREPRGASGAREPRDPAGGREARGTSGVRGSQALRRVRGLRSVGEARPPAGAAGVSGGDSHEESGTQVEPGAAEGPGRSARPAARLWHVTLSVSGGEAPLDEVRRGLEQLAHDHPFLLTSRYAGDHAEIRYWEEARDLHDAAAVALRLWGEHRRTARLPAWEIVGLEVIGRETYRQRVAAGYGPAPATPVGVHPF